MLLLDNAEVAQTLDMRASVEALEQAVRDTEAGETVARPTTSLVMPVPPEAGEPGSYELRSREGIARGQRIAACRLMSDRMALETRPDGTRTLAKVAAAPGGRFVGLMLLFDTDTTELVALFPDAEIQRRRVGATAALAAKYAARANARTLGVLGSGWQAETAVIAHCLVRAIDRVRVYSPNREHREAFCARLRPQVAGEVEPVASAADAVRGSDIVVALTSSLAPVIPGELLDPGAHVSTGTDFELDEAGYHRCAFIVEGSRFRAGDGQAQWGGTGGNFIRSNTYVMGGQAVEGTGVAHAPRVPFADFPARRVSLPELVLGEGAGRQNDEEISAFYVSTPSGIHLAYLGALVVQEARRRGLGRSLPDEWFSQVEPD